MAEQRVVDARGQMPPAPLEMTLDALDDLPEDGELVLLIHREPGPLYSFLDQNGYVFETDVLTDGTFRILIRGDRP